MRAFDFLLGSVFPLAVASGCATAAAAPRGPDAGSDAGAPRTELLAWVDLRQTAPHLDDLTHGLSGTWYDAATHTLYALQDSSPRLVRLEVSSDYRSIRPVSSIVLTGRPGGAWDGEALTRKGKEFYVVAEETTAVVERFDDTGAFQGTVPMPAPYRQNAHRNKGLESLTISPSGAFLFAANESALTTDGGPATATTGTTVRILRRDLASRRDEGRAYRTQPLSRGMGVSEMLALSDTELLVLERDFQPGVGNTVRLFHVDFASSGPGSADILAAPSLDASTPVLPKTLLLDFVTLPSAGVPHPGVQPNNILDNYEALALGPRLDDGRQIVFVTSDDNGDRDGKQVARVLVLALRL